MIKDNQQCLFSIEKFLDFFHRAKNQQGFMGFTHALSAVALVAVLVSFAPHIFYPLIGTSIPMLILLFFVIAGGALVPDLDNTNSTAESALGPFGNIVSTIFRSSSVVLQTIIRTPRDSPDPNPHRGAWHSPIFCTLLALLVYLGSSIQAQVNIPIINNTYTIGEIFSIIFTSLLILIGFSGLFKKFMKKIKNKGGGGILGDIFAFIFSFIFTISLYSLRPENINPLWLPVGFYIGMLIHHLGDGFTTSGNPYLAPIPWRGKCWWNFRLFPHIRAGGAAENYLFIPLFLVIIIIAAGQFIYSTFIS